MREGYELIIPEPSRRREVAQELLAVADDPTQVATQRGGTEFLVPAAVAQRWRDSLSPKPRGRRKKED